MKRILAVLQKIENWTIIVTFIVMTLAAFAQVLNRNIFHIGISWFEELSRYCMVYMALLATEVGLRDGSQIAIVMVVERFKGVPRILLDILAKTVVVAFSGIVFWYSIDMLKRQIATGQISPGLRIPMLFPYAAVTIAFLLIAVVQAVAIFALVGSLFSGADAAGEGGAA